MSTQKQLSRTTGTERMFKEELALSLICWVFTSPFTNWTDKVFSGIEVPSEGPSTLLGEAEKFFRFVVNEEGYDAGRAALGLDLCCFSLPSCLFPDAALSEEEVMSKLTGEVIHGILLSLPEFIDMPEVLAYQVRDEIRHCCKVSDEAAFCLIQRPYISKTLLTRRISPRGSP